MDKKKVVFISLPMSGRTDSEVQSDIIRAQFAFVHRVGFGRYEDFIFTDNFISDSPENRSFVAPDGLSDNQKGVWYLARALNKLANADICVFYGEWRSARGCLVEHEVCEKYDIQIMEV